MIASGNIGCLTQLQNQLAALRPPDPGAAHDPDPRPRLLTNPLKEPTPRCPTRRSLTSRSTSAPAPRSSRPRRSPSSPSLHGRFDARRLRAAGRAPRAPRRDRRGGQLDFLAETARDPRGRILAGRARRAPTTSTAGSRSPGRPTAKLVINALNSGAKGFMADFEDANSPTWANQVAGHANLIDAIEGTITYDASDGRHYAIRPPSTADAAGPPARLAPARAPPRPSTAPVGRRRRSSTSASSPSTTRPRSPTGARRLPLPAEDGAPPRGAALERGVRLRRGRARASSAAPSAPPC